jgi:RNA-splicing ligase RtcB
MSDGSPNWEKIKRAFDGEEIAELGDAIAAYGSDENRNTKLDYLEGAEKFGYLKDMVFTQEYASDNRHLMAREVAKTLNASIVDVIDSPHNYVDFTDGVIRKGSTRSHENETFVVPMNMEEGTLVCRGKGNSDWNYSAPHGAGRLGSRGWAHEQFDADEARKRMYDNGTYSSNVPGDEVPEAYKETALIEEQIKPTAEVVDRLVPKMNFKA